MLRFIIALLAAVSFSVSAHHLSPTDMIDFIEDQLISVDSPHLLSTEDDPSLVAVYGGSSSLEDVDYVAVIIDSDISAILAEIEDILLMLEDGNDVEDFEVLIEFDMDTGLYTVTLYVDFIE